MRNLTMMTDLYQLTMMYGYYNTNTHLRQAVFDLYFRRPNVNSAYAIAAGLEQVMDYIENLHFSEEDLGYLKSLNLFSREFWICSENCLPVIFMPFRKVQSCSLMNQ